jgi:hypothetical protein
MPCKSTTISLPPLTYKENGYKIPIRPVVLIFYFNMTPYAMHTYLVSPVREGHQLVDECHIDTLELGGQLQHAVVHVVCEAQVLVARGVALLAARVHTFFGLLVDERKQLGLQKLDRVALTGLNRLIELPKVRKKTFEH